MKPNHITQARDIIANRETDARAFFSGGGDLHTGFGYLANNDYIIASMDPIYGWKAALDEIERLRGKLAEIGAALMDSGLR